MAAPAGTPRRASRARRDDAEPAAPAPRTPAMYLKAAPLVALMMFGSFMLWIGFPVGWVWVGSQLSSSSQPSLTPYLVVGAGFLVSVVIDYKLLVLLNALYARAMQTSSRLQVRAPTAWLRSMRDDRERRISLSPLEVIMIGTVVLALVAFGIWFFLFAGSSLPGGTGPAKS